MEWSGRNRLRILARSTSFTDSVLRNSAYSTTGNPHSRCNSCRIERERELHRSRVVTIRCLAHVTTAPTPGRVGGGPMFVSQRPVPPPRVRLANRAVMAACSRSGSLYSTARLRSTASRPKASRACDAGSGIAVVAVVTWNAGLKPDEAQESPPFRLTDAGPESPFTFSAQP